MKLSVILFMSAFLPSLALASCNFGETIDLRKTYPKAYDNMSIGNQGQYGICYAYAGTSLLDFHRLKNGGSTSTLSPLEAGVLGNAMAEVHDEVGGQICDVVNAVADRGYGCNHYSVLNEEMFKDLGIQVHTELVNNVFMPFIMRSQIYKEIMPEQYKSQVGLNKVQKDLLLRMKKSYQTIRKLVLAKGFPETNMPKESEVFFLAQDIHLDQRYGALGGSFNLLILGKSCKTSQLKVPKIHCEESKGSGWGMISDIDHSIDSKRPVGISYCASVMGDKKFKGVDSTGKTKSNCGEHASVIIGRKSDTKTNTCYYLVRNSWGANHSYNWETSNGDIWVSEEALKNNVFGVSTVY